MENQRGCFFAPVARCRDRRVSALRAARYVATREELDAEHRVAT